MDPHGFYLHQVAIKFLERGSQSIQIADREVLNMQICSMHPHIVRFREVSGYPCAPLLPVRARIASGPSHTSPAGGVQPGPALHFHPATLQPWSCVVLPDVHSSHNGQWDRNMLMRSTG